MNDVTKRFLEVIDGLKISDYSLSKEVEGLSTQTLSKIRNDKSNISLTTLTLFCEHYPQFNADWIVTGRGSKYIDSVNKYIAPKEESQISEEVEYLENNISYLMELLADQAKQKGVLEIENKIMMKKLQDAIKEIEDLKK